jgi:hypothetical protein
LLIIVANNLVNNVLPVAIDSTIKKAAVVEWLSGWQISLALSSNDSLSWLIGAGSRFHQILTSVFHPDPLALNSGA